MSIKVLLSRCLFWLFAVAFIVTVRAHASDNRVKYSISFEQAVHHLAEVTVELPNHSEPSIDVQMPAWRSGRYEILDLAKQVRNFSVKDKKGKTLAWQQMDKSTWRIESDGKAVVINYLLYANELGDRTRHIDETHAYLDASAVFLYAPSMRHFEIEVELDTPRKWRSVSGMKRLGKHKFFAPNYDHFIDSPIETGIHSSYTFAVNERKYEAVFWSRGNYQADKIIRDLAKLDIEAAKIWGTFPFDYYVYIFHATDGPRGATEHINSTVIQRQRDKFEPRKDYINLILTAAHELVHTWNVKAYRPSGLVPYDFQHENYSKLLWVAEGTTSYFVGLIVRRANISTEKEFLEELTKSIETHLNRPGRQVQSIADASFNAWIEKTNDFTVNHGVNIYSEGALASWALDFYIRDLTEDKASLETVHKKLYQEFDANNLGFTVDDFKRVIEDVTGSSIEMFWNTYIDNTQPINFETLLSQVGLKLQLKATAQEKFDLGITFDKTQPLLIDKVQKDSVAWKAGLTKGDRLVAIDGLRLSKDNLKLKMDELTHKTITLHYFRRDELASLTLKPVKNLNRGLELVVIENPSEQQKLRYKLWTGHELSNISKSKQADEPKELLSSDSES